MTVLGIDTSCYRTSAALVENGAVIKDKRLLVEVGKGERGLRQSEGLFWHVQNIASVMSDVFDGFNGQIDAVCVSARPRDVEGSYMPVFTAGEAVARSIASAVHKPLFTTSHQQGHIRAALSGCDFPKGDFLALHLSGGTTELLKVTGNLHVDMWGKTSDLNAGQLVDRIGVKLGLPFPAGSYLEQLAKQGESRSLAPTAINASEVSLSGAEARLMNMVDGGVNSADVACEVYSFIERTLAKWIDRAVTDTGLKSVLMAGGVSASERLRREVPARLKKRGSNAVLYWPDPKLSGDNAVGVALIGEDMLKKDVTQCQAL